MKRKGQTTTEYLFLIAGILVLVVLITVLIRGGIFNPAQQDIGQSADTLKNLTATIRGG
ncbi:MAG TPA: class III signal peptide-containing protein [Candidatus Norongarragalinales archaeon]|nr:class III signal peptide-containing protein [Candidatus Norongarragalinales archaeon]